MTEIRFYHLQRHPLEAVLPRLLEKVVDNGSRAIVMAGSKERVESLNALLWAYAPGSFLPHGSAEDGFVGEQVIYLTCEPESPAENPNKADILVLTDGASVENVLGFKKCLELFDGNDPAALAEARKRWKTYQDSGFDLVYYQQNDAGGWEVRA